MRMVAWLYCLTLESIVIPELLQLFLRDYKEVLSNHYHTHAHTIPFGDMVTLLTYHLGVDVSSLHPAGSSYTFDLGTLIEAHMIDKGRIPHVIEGFCWLSRLCGEHHQYLPIVLPIGPTLDAFHIRHNLLDEDLVHALECLSDSED